MLHEPEWLKAHRARQPYGYGESTPYYSRHLKMMRDREPNKLVSDQGFNSHATNDGQHVSPFDQGGALIGVDGLKVRLVQGVNEDQFKATLSRTVKATTGIRLDAPEDPTDWEESMRGGLQMNLESQNIIFEVEGASRALTHQLVRSTRARFMQQSQRATWFGDRPNVRVPESIARNPIALAAWERAAMAAWEAYRVACDEGISYQDARYGLLEGTTNYIACQYSIREFINVFAYRGCSMFLWEMVHCMREMRRVLLEAHPFLEPYIKISCEKPTGDCPECEGKGGVADPSGLFMMERCCSACGGDGKQRKCTFQGWENVEPVCSFPWARQDNRTFLPTPKFRINSNEQKETN